MSAALLPPPSDQGLHALTNLVTDAANIAPRTKVIYGRMLTRFLAWCGNPPRPLSKALVQEYLSALADSGLGAVGRNQSLTAIKRLALEASDNGYLDPQISGAINRIKGTPVRGRGTGRWLDKEAYDRLRELPDPSSLAGLRDRALLALLMGGALRRQEASTVLVCQCCVLEGRGVIADVKGKGNRTRTVPIAPWAWEALQRWIHAAGLRPTDRLLRGVTTRYDTDGKERLSRHGLSGQAIWLILQRYARQLDIPFRPHDLRRSFARLARLGGSPLEQIQLTLGHASITTTEVYLGGKLNLEHSAADYISELDSTMDDSGANVQPLTLEFSED